MDSRLQASVEGEGANRVLVLRLPFSTPGNQSASGKTMVVATTNGNLQTDIMVDGQPVTVGVNAYYKPRK